MPEPQLYSEHQTSQHHSFDTCTAMSNGASNSAQINQNSPLLDIQDDNPVPSPPYTRELTLGSLVQSFRGQLLTNALALTLNRLAPYHGLNSVFDRLLPLLSQESALKPIWIAIEHEALRHNVNLLKATELSGRGLCAVVKCNAIERSKNENCVYYRNTLSLTIENPL